MVLDVSVAVGSRLQIGRDCATIRYVGPIEGQVGDWVGLEWDDPARGKHDGSTGGRQYFTCIHSAGAGSFVRLSKLLPTVQPPVTLLQALRRRYQGGAADGCACDEIPATGEFRGLRGVEAVLVGQEEVLRRQGRLDQLQAAVLINSCVSTATCTEPVPAVDDSTVLLLGRMPITSEAKTGSKAEHVNVKLLRIQGAPGALVEAAPALVECDLTGNLLPDWAAVAAVLRELPRLRVLNLTASRLAPPSPTAEPAALGPFNAVRTLVLNRCGMQRWGEVLTVVSTFPQLRELRLAGNGIADLQPAADLMPSGFRNLQVLDLDDNELASWADVQTLGRLPCLERLSLTGNSIVNIAGPGPAATGGFPALRALVLGDNSLASWTSVDALTSFPSLREARLSGNAALGADQSHVRSEVIARVGALTLLNGSEVSQYERRNSELQYLRRLLGDLESLADSGARTTLERANPRLPELAAKYGMMAGVMPSSTTRSSAGGMPLGSTMLRLSVTFRMADGQAKTVTKRLPGSTTIGNVRVLAERLFKVKAARQALALRLPGDKQLRSLGSDDTQSLSFFEIEEGSEILISEEDAVARAAETEAMKRADAALRERCMDQQLKEGDALLHLRHAERAATVMPLKTKVS